jgi:hypothetical protein
MPKKIPKWMTDKVWALRRAVKKGKLPDDVETLFLGDSNACLSYAKALNSRLPAKLEKSVEALLKDASGCSDRNAVNWIVSYRHYSTDISPGMEKTLVKRIKNYVSSRYDWGLEKALKYASLCAKVPPELERAMWASPHSAFRYAMQSGMRIPADLEAETISKFDEDEVIAYARKMFGGRLPAELEGILADMPEAAQAYAKDIMLGRLPEELHSAMVMRSFEDDETVRQTVSEYLKFVKKSYNYARNVLANFDKNATVEDVLKSIGSEIEYTEE